MKKEFITIMSQAFYGNRTVTEVRRDKVDYFVVGCLNPKFEKMEKVQRTIVTVPNTDNLVILYNQIEEIKRLEEKARYEEKDGYILQPLAVIPEVDLEIYSRCIACRIDEKGQLQSLEDEDFEIIDKYFLL